MDRGEPAEDMILLMGVTGAGKSFFINKLVEGAVLEGPNLQSCTKTCQMVKTCVGNTDVTVVDCPGFDDTKRSDTEILEEIANLLSTQYILGLKLKGIVYLHRITDNRMSGSAVKNLELFTKLVGDEALSNVVLVTTMWGNILDEHEANQRDSELRDEFWCDMIEKGSSASRFDGTKASAEGILAQLLGKKDVILKVQHELVDQEKKLNQTAAGAFLEPRVHAQALECKERAQQMEKKLETETNRTKRLNYQMAKREAEAGRKQRELDKNTLEGKPGKNMKARLRDWGAWKGRLQVLSAILGVGVTVVVNLILPLAGVGFI